MPFRSLGRYIPPENTCLLILQERDTSAREGLFVVGLPVDLKWQAAAAPSDSGSVSFRQKPLHISDSQKVLMRTLFLGFFFFGVPAVNVL